VVKNARNGITVFIPCNTVLVYVPHSMVQVCTKPPYTQVCVCVCVCAWTDVPTHTWTETNGHFHTHEHRHTTTQVARHMLLLPPHKHTHMVHTITHTNGNTHANTHWSHVPTHVETHSNAHIQVGTHTHNTHTCMHVHVQG